MSRNNYIIGGGISGLVWNFYSPDYKIITPDIGGQFGKTMMVWLHDLPETRKLLTDLGWKDADKRHHKVYIGYYYKGWLHERITPEINTLLIQKKMTDWNLPIDTSFKPSSLDMSKTSHKTINYLETLDVDLEEVIKRLSEHSKMTQGVVRSITDSYIVVTDELTSDINSGRTLEYDKLVSTIAAPLFWSIYQGSGSKMSPLDFKSKVITNVITKQKPPLSDDKFEMIYYDGSVPYCRTSKIGKYYAYEFTGYVPRGTITEILPGVEVEDYLVIKNGRIFNVEKNEPPKNTVFLGRFSSWRFGETTEHIIKQTFDYKNK